MDHRSSTLPRFELGNEIIFTTLKQPLDNAENAPSTPESDPVIEYLNQILLEDDDNDQSISYDPIALRAAEKSFYEALHMNPSPPYQQPVFVNNISGASSDHRTSESTISICYESMTLFHSVLLTLEDQKSIWPVFLLTFLSSH
ncbi:unnamed protein product [Cuscuta campestris]|uniref:Uncharacterized protein n=1 Tax=Cuscuta campestris TaxID=132261 RepID=A0A484ND68_9ASTE|nr:unnamed protein product [Cuscuta campestris]